MTATPRWNRAPRTYVDIGTYHAVLTFTDDDGGTHSNVATVTVTESGEWEIDVQDQVVIRERVGRYVRVWDYVLVTDQDNQPVEGVMVVANYTGPNRGQASGVTASDGRADLITTWIRRRRGLRGD